MSNAVTDMHAPNYKIRRVIRAIRLVSGSAPYQGSILSHTQLITTIAAHDATAKATKERKKG